MRRTKLLILASIAATALITVLLGLREPESIAFHYNRLLRLQNPSNRFPPADLKGYLRLQTLSWFLQGRPSRQQQIERERRTLIRLGFFEEREFLLRRRVLDHGFIGDLNRALSTNTSLRTYRALSYDKPGQKVHVTIRKDCMPLFANIVTELDRMPEHLDLNQ